ncbi:ADAMTS-like protein 4 isoform 2-T2 [Discoglossus pictus]
MNRSIRTPSLAFCVLCLLVVRPIFGQKQLNPRTPRQTLEDAAVGNKIAGTWGTWSSWSVCSQTCGIGVIERSRTCLPPYQQVPWVPAVDPAPHILQTHSQPPFHDERPNPYPFGEARPSYPLHTDGEVAPPFIEPPVPRNPPSARYNPFNRHTRQETLPSGSQSMYQKRDRSSYPRSSSNPNRGRTRPRLPETPQIGPPYGQDGLYASEALSGPRRSHQDASSTFSRRNISRQDDSSAPWPFFPDSIPLLKPESWEDLNPGRLSPTKESRFTRRSHVRNAIKPGKYGYGKVPFALPLHKNKEESQRFKRHNSHHVDGTSVSPTKEKIIKPTQPSSEEEHNIRPLDQSSDLLVELQSNKETSLLSKQPEKSENMSMVMWLGGSQQRPLEGESSESVYYRDSNVKSVAETQTKDLNTKSNTSRFVSATEETRSGDLKPTPKEDHGDSLHYNDFMENKKTQVTQRPSQGHKVSSTEATDIGWSEKVPTEKQPYVEKKQESRRTYRAKMFGTTKPLQNKVAIQRLKAFVKSSSTDYQLDPETLKETEWRNVKMSQLPKEHVVVSHQGLRSHQQLEKNTEDSSSEIKQDDDEFSPFESQSKTDSSNIPRSRSQRQSPYRHGVDNSRVYHSLFREPASAHRQPLGDTWPSYGVSPAVPYDEGQGPRPGLHQSSDVPQWNLYNPGTENYHCVGEQNQYKSCNLEPCPSGQPDGRAQQCATFNSQEFMGRLYQWEAFTEVRGNQRCELNCRPIGYRFYVRHTEKVQDGTPCEPGSFDVCVGGQCLSPGCDGILGSNSTLDVCGVCGGNNSSCRFISGTFNETNVPIGYHKILEIPKGAAHINVTELTRSPNYLALRSRSGKSVINGNWAVDPSGRYEAGGTVFIYHRPGREENGGEIFTAAGPTTEALDVYMIFQQDNPGVSYQFFISSPAPLDNPAHNPQPIPPQNLPHNPPPNHHHYQRQDYGALRTMSASEPVQHSSSHGYSLEERNPVSMPQQRPPPVRPAGTLQRNIRIPPIPAPPVHYWPEQPDFFWKRVGNTPCSVTCGKGFWYPIYQCVSRSSLDEVSEEECDLSNKPFPLEEACNTQACPAFWDVGNWSVCSRTCGNGIQHRQVLCRQLYANRTTMVHPQRCKSLVKPNVTQTCQLRICSQWEVQSNWSTCSVMCGVGQRTRHVRCISNHGDIVGDGECSNRLRPRTNEVCDMGPCVKSWFHNDWSSKCSAECGTGIQRRSVFCLSSSSTDESQDSCVGTKPSDMRVCNSGPCERTVRWYTGPWSECSADCEEGSQRRDVICVSKLGSEFNVTDQSECAHLEKPPALQSCNERPCGSRWFTSPWSACSQSCLGGIQMREVRCLASDKTFSQLCDLDAKPDDKKVCNTQPCSAALGEKSEESAQP